MHSDSKSSTHRPDWTYSVQAPQVLSALWLLQLLSWLGIPIAIVGVLATAKFLGWIDFN